MYANLGDGSSWSWELCISLQKYVCIYMHGIQAINRSKTKNTDCPPTCCTRQQAKQKPAQAVTHVPCVRIWCNTWTSE